jgi:hypothetical protein
VVTDLIQFNMRPPASGASPNFAMPTGSKQQGFSIALQSADTQTRSAPMPASQTGGSSSLLALQIKLVARTLEKDQGRNSAPPASSPGAPPSGNMAVSASPAPAISVLPADNVQASEKKGQTSGTLAEPLAAGSSLTEAVDQSPSFVLPSGTPSSTASPLQGSSAGPTVTAISTLPPENTLKSQMPPAAAMQEEPDLASEQAIKPSDQNIGAAEATSCGGTQAASMQSFAGTYPDSCAAPDLSDQANGVVEPLVAFGPSFTPGSQMPGELRGSERQSPLTNASSQGSKNSDALASASKSTPDITLITRTSALVSTMPSSGANQSNATPRRQTDAGVPSGKVLTPQESASILPLFFRDGTKAASVRSQIDASTAAHGNLTNGSMNNPHGPAMNSVNATADSSNSQDSANSANTLTVTNTEPAPAAKAQAGSTDSSSPASSLIGSIPAPGRAETSGAAPTPEETLPVRSAPASDPTTGVVQVARIVDGLSRSEMHIDMRTQDFGSVEVHTVLRESQLGLSVGSEKGDLRGFLAPEVPSLQAVIHQQDLRLDTLHFLDHSAQSSGQFSGSGDRQAQSQNRGQAQPSAIPMADTPVEETLPYEITNERVTGLSVHA